MRAMHARPPDWTVLHRGLAERRHDELPHAARLVRAVRKIAMKRARDAELADEEHERTQHACLPIETGPENPETHEMDADEKNTGQRQAGGSMHKVVNVRHFTRRTIEKKCAECTVEVPEIFAYRDYYIS